MMRRYTGVLLAGLFLLHAGQSAQAQIAQERVPPGSNIRLSGAKGATGVEPEKLAATFSNMVVEIELAPVDVDARQLRYFPRSMKMETRANRDASLTGLLEITDETGAFVNSAKYIFKIYEGRQITDIGDQVRSGEATISRLVFFTKVGKYCWKLRVFEGKDELATLTTETLIGVTQLPVKRSVGIKILKFELYQSKPLYKPMFTVRTENTGNAVLLGYYRIDSYADGVRVMTAYQENYDNAFKVPPPQSYVFLTTQEPDNFHSQTYRNVMRAFRKGERAKIAVSFIEVEGGILATAESEEILAQ